MTEDEWWYPESPWLDLEPATPPNTDTIIVDHTDDQHAPWILYGPDGETIISQIWEPIGFARAIP